jgi:hypothetical protein
MDNLSTQDQYWASLPPLDLTRIATRKVSDYYSFMVRYGFQDKFKRAYLAYYGISEAGMDSSKLNQAGTNGENYVIKVNHIRSLLQNLLTLTTSQRPALQPKAQNTDAKSMNQTILARSVLDYYMTEKRLEIELKRATEFALISGEGFVAMDWDASMGNVYDVGQDGQPVYDGDLTFNTFHPIDVIRECWSENTSPPPWKIIREFKNKYDLAAKYPEMSQDILAISTSPDYFTRYTFLTFDALSNADFIPVYTLYHEQTAALPNGRQFQFLDTDLFLNDGPLAYKHMPIYRISPSDFFGTPFGYTVAYDLMGLQKVYDSLASIITTNQLNYGVQNILIPRGAEMNVVSLAQGLNAIEYDKNIGKPEPLNLVATPGEIFTQMDRIQKTMETLSGVNSVARGNPETSLHSGSALALVAAQAVQFNNGLQNSYNRLLEDVGTGVIEILQEYAATPRIASIAGKSNRFRVTAFKGEDLNGINRVCVETVNPISKTAAGRLQEAQDLLQNKLITNPAHYFEVLMTGTIDSLTEHETSQILNIRSENEDLQSGLDVPVVITDQHVAHIKEHGTCLDSPEARRNPKIVAAVTKHIQDHIQQLKTGDPQVLQLLGQTPLPPTPPGQPLPPGGGPGSPPPQGGPPKPPGPPQGASAGPSGVAATQNPTPPGQQQANAVKPSGMPNLPKAATGAAHDAFAAMKANTQG